MLITQLILILLSAAHLRVEALASTNSSSFDLPYLDNQAYEKKYRHPPIHTKSRAETSFSQAASKESDLFLATSTPFKFGERISTSIDMKKNGHWTELPDGSGKMWQLHIRSPNALSLNFLCDQFKLPSGTKLLVKGQHAQLGPFTAETSNKHHGHFVTVPVKGHHLTLEYYQPSSVKGEAEFHICYLVHGFALHSQSAQKDHHKDVEQRAAQRPPSGPWEADFVQKSAFGHLYNSQSAQQSAPGALAYTEKYGLEADKYSAGKCHINAPQCRETHSWQRQVQATVLIMTDDGTGYCTGCMVNNANQDGRQLLLTAKHCILESNKYNYRYNTVVFNYQASRCDTSISEREGSTLKKREDGKRSGVRHLLHQTVQGLKLLASSALTDYALFEIEEAIPRDYQVYLAGWSTATMPPTAAVCIHHPSGDLKKISFKDEAVQSLCIGQHCLAISTGLSVSIHNDLGWIVAPGKSHYGNHWLVDRWTQGATEKGSSGGPLFNREGLLIGQLRGGTSNCNNQGGHDIFGALAASMASGLAQFLNPESIVTSDRLQGAYLNDLRPKVEPKEDSRRGHSSHGNYDSHTSYSSHSDRDTRPSKAKEYKRRISNHYNAIEIY